jgi:hypothetical protein
LSQASDNPNDALNWIVLWKITSLTLKVIGGSGRTKSLSWLASRTGLCSAWHS